MEPEPSATRERILLAAYRLFYAQGFSRVSVDAIATAADVTKRTVYYHFKSKDDIVADMLDYQHAHMMAQFERWAGPDEAGPLEMIERLFVQLQKWADGENWLGSGFTRITTELADMPGHPARRAASVHKAKIEQWLAVQLAAKGLAMPDQRSAQIMVLIEGAMSLALIHGDTGYIDKAADAANQLLGGMERSI